jgi:hypothetical protein
VLGDAPASYQGEVDLFGDFEQDLVRHGGDAAFDELVAEQHRGAPRDTPGSWRAESAGMHLPNSGAAARFGSPELEVFPHGQRRTADSLVATLATRAGVLVMPEPEQDNTLRRIRAYLASRAENADGGFVLPMLTGVLRVRRL